ncbi:MAG: HAD-IC family P-type ATPase, partial [Gammaproteobacteria bacterium]
MPEQPTGLPLTAPHAQPADAVLSQLGVTSHGLSLDEARARLDSHGYNRLPEPPKVHPLLRFLRHFHNVLIYVLLGSALVTLLLEHYTDTAVILAVVLINAVIGFVQEGRAEQAMNAIRRMLAPVAAVVRDGQRLSVAGETLVPGDIVLLEAGDRVPADLRLLSGNALQIQEAILTGESVAVLKQLAPVAQGAPLGDRSCMAYSGTLVTSGQGRGVVVATGAHTEIGRVSGLLARVEPLVTPLVAQMAIFARWLTLVILAVAAGLLLFGHFIQDYPFADLFMAVVGLSVAAIPEGLPAVLTITLSVGVQTIARRNVIVRRLPAIETLGAVSVICSDKTGTLTRNEMMVVAAATGGGPLSITGTGYAPVGAVSRGTDVVDPDGTHPYRQLGFAAALCNDAAIREQADGWIVEGDPMEGALLAFACKLGIGAAERQHWQRTDLIPFDPRHRYMATLNHDHEHHAAIFVKGAPEKLLALCEYQTGADGSPQPLCVDDWHRQVTDLSAQGQRVLALAMKPVDVSHTVLESSDLKQGLILLGLVG